MRRLLISIDLDGLDEYAAIHGLGAAAAGPRPAPSGPADQALADLMYRAALPRFSALLAELGAPATCFVIGRDVAVPGVPAALRALVAAGHEVGNHSFGHDYRLSTRAPAAIAADLRAAHQALAAALGPAAPAPRGVRAPGYHVSPAFLDAAARLGYRYDASRLPSPPYYAAKAAAYLAYRLRGRPSGAYVGSPLDFAPRRAPQRLPQGLWELPISCLGPLRVPAIGLPLAVAPGWLFERLCAWGAALPDLHVEFHGLDFIDAATDGVPAALVAAQPDLRVGLARRLERYRAFLTRAGAGRRPGTLGAWCQELLAGPG